MLGVQAYPLAFSFFFFESLRGVSLITEAYSDQISIKLKIQKHYKKMKTNLINKVSATKRIKM